MLATDSTASGIAGQTSIDSTAWFTLPTDFVANFAPKGFERALVARSGVVRDALATASAAVGVVATPASSRSSTTHVGAGDAPYEHR